MVFTSPWSLCSVVALTSFSLYSFSIRSYFHSYFHSHFHSYFHSYL